MRVRELKKGRGLVVVVGRPSDGRHERWHWFLGFLNLKAVNRGGEGPSCSQKRRETENHMRGANQVTSLGFFFLMFRTFWADVGIK